ncbi:hypothetical protein [Micavibrio aeruginosavorus]|uniref:hypothetical protein n=1 Tax=Micavibrio aeruginosavorus TaxID=349221 RepID=UPI003F4AAEA1
MAEKRGALAQRKTTKSQSDKAALSYRPPVTALSGEAGVGLVRAHIDRLLGADGADAVAYESDRLAPYMTALGQRLAADGVVQATEPSPFNATMGVVAYHKFIETAPSPETQFEPGRVRGVFNTMAADTGNLVLSEVAIVSADVWDRVVSDDRLKAFSRPSDIAGRKYQLGFIQCMKQTAQSSVAFPVMGLDSDLMDRIAPYDPADLLESLSAIATIANHDVLHGLTSTAVSQSITHEFRKPEYGDVLNGFLTAYLAFRTNEKDADDYADSYEAWALASHADTYREMRTNGDDRNLDVQVERYCDALERIDAALEKDGASPDMRHRYMDYLGTVALYSLVRVLPVDDPLMGRALTRMETLTRPDGSDLVQYMRDRWRNKDTRYPEHVNLDHLGAMYLEFLGRPGFMTDDVLMDLNTALSTCLQYECEKPADAQNKVLHGASSIGGVRQFEKQPVAIQETIKAYARGLAHVRFDEEASLRDPALCHVDKGGNADRFQQAVAPIWPRPDMPEGMRIGVLNKMKQTRNAVVGAMFRSLQNYLHRHPSDPDFETNMHRLGVIHFDGLRRQVVRGVLDGQVGPTLAYRAVRNYRHAGINILGREGREPSWRQMKIWDVMRTTPVIPYILSPAIKDEELARMHRISKTVDRGVVAILGTGQSAP